MKNIKISILIPLYNQEILIRKCLDSIPDREDIEIIVVDDNSIDNSYNIVKENYPKVKLFKNNINVGVGLTRNKLLEKAVGEYIFFLDSDDFLYTEEFINVIDNVLSNQIILKPRCKRNDGKVFYSSVHRGDFLNRKFISQVKFKNMRQNEDTDFKNSRKKLFGYKVDKVENIIYHYNEPRIGSLTWEDRKKRKVKGYDKGIEEWERTYNK